MKQAYLIIAHRSDLTFRTLLRMLDNPGSDIFVHMDAKNRAYSPDEIAKLVKHSGLFHTEKRIKVSWGAFSQVESEFLLLEAATSHGHYEHYHLLSGQDLPIQSQDYIINFFEANHGVEFIHFSDRNLTHPMGIRSRRYYFLFQEILGNRSASRLHRIIKNLTAGIINSASLKLQRLFNVNRNHDISFRTGANWFDITDELARYVLTKREYIRKILHHTLCPDELFLQTLVWDSPFREKIFWDVHNDDYEAIMRLIDWKRGSPYTFRLDDIDELRESKMLFARKFDSEKDSAIIAKIRELYSVATPHSLQ